jgi:hypothetical protein
MQLRIDCHGTTVHAVRGRVCTSAHLCPRSIVGIAKVAANGLNGVPTLDTTYSRAIEYIPTTRFTI